MAKKIWLIKEKQGVCQIEMVRVCQVGYVWFVYIDPKVEQICVFATRVRADVAPASHHTGVLTYAIAVHIKKMVGMLALMLASILV